MLYTAKPVQNGTQIERNPVFSAKLSQCQGSTLQITVLTESACNGKKTGPLQFRYSQVSLKPVQNGTQIERNPVFSAKLSQCQGSTLQITVLTESACNGKKPVPCSSVTVRFHYTVIKYKKRFLLSTTLTSQI